MTKNRRFKRWEDIDSGKISDFKALYYVTQRVISKTERKIIQMGQVYKALEKELQELKNKNN